MLIIPVHVLLLHHTHSIVCFKQHKVDFKRGFAFAWIKLNRNFNKERP